MAKVEIDITEEIEKEIQKQVEKELDNGGMLRFIRNCVKQEFYNSKLTKQLNRHETLLVQMKKRFEEKD